MASKHDSDSQAQRDAQQTILELAASELPAEWINSDGKPLRIYLPAGAYVEVDGISESPLVLAEVYASPRQKGLLAGQKKKLATDFLKLITVKQSMSDVWATARCVLLFASQDAVDGVTGWLRESAAIWNIELIALKLAPELDRILSGAQETQGRWISDANQSP